MEYPRAGVLILAPFVVGYYLSYLFRTINALIADRLAAELALTASQLGLLTAAYFVTFAAIQLPLGVWLDRHGPRRVQSMLLSTAAVGVTTFSLAGGFISLLIGRALIGFGAAGALMAGLKAIALWFPKERVTLLNGLFVTLGALGAVTATAPAEAVLDMTGWRGLFIVLAPATALCAAAIFLFVPDPAGRTKSSSGVARLSRPIGLKEIFADPRFWRLAPLSATCIGTSWACKDYGPPPGSPTSSAWIAPRSCAACSSWRSRCARRRSGSGWQPTAFGVAALPCKACSSAPRSCSLRRKLRWFCAGRFRPFSYGRS